MNKLFVMRHSERIDEVDHVMWHHIAKAENKSGRNHHDFLNDPILTEQGRDLAHEAARTLEQLLDREENKLQYIFCSRLRRCVETAHALALRLRIPIYICKGLALTAMAVEHRGGLFEFHDIDEMRRSYPDIEIHDCDDLESEAFKVPSHDWLAALIAISSSHPLSIVVSHRETIRNLAPGFRNTPYCCIGEFSFQIPTSSDGTQSTSLFRINRVLNRDGSIIFHAGGGTGVAASEAKSQCVTARPSKPQPQSQPEPSSPHRPVDLLQHMPGLEADIEDDKIQGVGYASPASKECDVM